MRRRTGLAILAVGACAAGAAAQTVTLDEGTFTVFIAGAAIGSETFIIRQNGSGENTTIVATCRTVIEASAGPRALQANLQIAGTAFRPAAYEVVEGADTIRGRVSGRRVTAKIISPTAENLREYLVSEGAILVDETVAHQHYFIARRMPEGGSRVPLVAPRESRQSLAEVTVEAAAPLTIAGEAVNAVRFRVAPASGDERFFWADDRGRVLRLEIPARNLVAERTAVPR
jgi:hypothetical protein